MLTPLVARARTLVSAPLLVLGALLASAAAATPAGAQHAPVSGDATAPAPAAVAAVSPVEAFHAAVEVVGRLRTRAEEAARAATRAAAAQAEADQVARLGCVESGTSNDIPRVVADIFRCRLRHAGVDDAEGRRIAMEAVMVAQCESRFDPNAVVFAGRYVHQAHWNGNRYTAAGVFQFIRATADRWIEGGYGQVHDPRRNIDAAARLYVANRAAGLGGWGDWACAAANDGFRHASVLPGWPGGPAGFPDWVHQYVP